MNVELVKVHPKVDSVLQGVRTRSGEDNEALTSTASSATLFFCHNGHTEIQYRQSDTAHTDNAHLGRTPARLFLWFPFLNQPINPQNTPQKEKKDTPIRLSPQLPLPSSASPPQSP